MWRKTDAVMNIYTFCPTWQVDANVTERPVSIDFVRDTTDYEAEKLITSHDTNDANGIAK